MVSSVLEGTLTSGMYQWYPCQGVSHSHLWPTAAIFFTKVTMAVESIMQVRKKHTLGFMLLVVVYVPSEIYEPAEKPMCFDNLDSILNFFSLKHTHC